MSWSLVWSSHGSLGVSQGTGNSLHGSLCNSAFQINASFKGKACKPGVSVSHVSLGRSGSARSGTWLQPSGRPLVRATHTRSREDPGT